MIFGYDTSSLLLEFSDRDGFYRHELEKLRTAGS